MFIVMSNTIASSSTNGTDGTNKEFEAACQLEVIVHDHYWWKLIDATDTTPVHFHQDFVDASGTAYVMRDTNVQYSINSFL